jgi:hypothetical protein
MTARRARSEHPLFGRSGRIKVDALQRRVARDRLGVEADVRPSGHLLPLAQPRLVADYLLQTTGRH